MTRAKIILNAVEGENNQRIADKLDLHVETARTWRERWVAVWTKLTEREAEVDDKTLLSIIANTLADQPRSGSPGKFSPEQIGQIVALACEFPAASGLPLSHWTPKDVAGEAIERGIVESISASSVERFLKSGRPQATPEPLRVEQ